MDVHLIPGLGADSRLFGRLKLPGHTLHYHAWPVIGDRPALRDYAQELASRIDKRVPHVLIGVSMGGMVAQEMAAITKPTRTIIISSWKGRHEMPWNISALRGLHPERLLTDTTVRRVVPMLRLLRYTLGLEDRLSQELGQRMLASFSARDLRAMVTAVVTWDGPAAPVQELVHIHGDKDRLMPIARIRDPIVIRGGTHFMVFSKPEEVSAAVAAAMKGLR
jgi:pimeloyl-ACP methyl ester carboxylesterase